MTNATEKETQPKAEFPAGNNRIDLKGLHHIAAMSEETECFNASLYVDGKNVGKVSNRGHGGCHEYRLNKDQPKDLIMQLEAWAKGLPEVQSEWGNFPCSIEYVINCVVEKGIIEKKLKRDAKNKVLIILPSHADGEYSIAGLNLASPDRHIASMQRKHPKGIIFNTHPDLFMAKILA